MQEYGLGRLQSIDSRDILYSLGTYVMSLPEVDSKVRYWHSYNQYFDQGPTSQCVEYAWHHWLVDSPIRHGEQPLWQFGSVYNRAQQIDEWEGEDYDGTSVRAGAKVLQELGYISQYLWTWDINTIIDTVLKVGPVVVGTYWYESMFYPDLSKLGRIEVNGRLAGGHAYVINGVNLGAEEFRIKNSWSRDWGRTGHARIKISDMERLINEDGEACLAVENKIVV